MPNIQKLIAAPGPRFILPMAGVLLLGLVLNSTWLAFLGLLGASFFAYFFRDPERPVPEDPGLIVAPADGKVVLVDEVREDKFLGRPAKRVGIFMNVFDVHVNRSPLAGTVVTSSHQAGGYKAAQRQDAAQVNEQQATMLEGEEGQRLLVVQIAGLLARRIISYVQPGQKLARGERLGMICFGSRVDLYLPPEAEVLVKVGDRVHAGSSVLGRWWLNAA
ncbi:MAG: phosphatidylserine decarboxylase family protein [Deltaproteobacteria bacterium]|nr:phosphatidylserine decarboxylase family protein [Deltaproteobacteria bacterium]MBI4795297.1 phosphatidylserine decarboxylase family protein [Deltaproteobacteria bacterium]